ncbi:MAG: 5-amino-6-(D-ribitylamino)uracil--L-tyrosine 4-hydroxyphenyl transferase CofH [Ideonella sp.]|nr:5-amino-6-(D-ribitylamino)uracil--L-tyrosine 4-hydroxyphenyl transferase CofH [Ideonella sp.]
MNAVPEFAAAQLQAIVLAAGRGERLCDDDALALAALGERPGELGLLMSAAAALRDRHFGARLTYSRKVFVPLTHACRNRCGYCTFARAPARGQRALMTPDEVLAVARAGQQAGCREALFTLGDKPELRFAGVRDELAALGHSSMVGYLAEMAGRVLAETGLLPHLNPGVLTRAEIDVLRPVAVSMGLMLESAAARLMQRGGPHAGAPDKHPQLRLAMIEAAGQAAVPFTSGLLVGIGETRRERIESLLALRAAHERHGHLQEVIVQNFRAKPGTRMAAAAEPSFDEHRWTIAIARLIFGGTSSIQAPPNLAAGALAGLVEAGIDDWGGVSPVTPDHVNPERRWPELDALARHSADAGMLLVERLAAHPRFVNDAQTWIDAGLRPQVRRHADADGLARAHAWAPGAAAALPAAEAHLPGVRCDGPVATALARALRGEPTEADIVALFDARGAEVDRVCAAADAIRRELNGDVVSYVVTRNITYTNLCRYRCGFCAFARGRKHEALRGAPYDYDMAEIARRSAEAWARGATEVCIQGGIHPAYTGRHYLDILAAVKAAAPGLHVHAFSPLEIAQGARSLGLSVREFLQALREAGLGSLPGTAAEILDDEVRRVICPDKLGTDEWLSVVQTAHELGLRSTATIMFGHVERPVHWARHLLHLRRLQQRTGGLTEFVPLPFVAGEAPLFLKGGSRAGPTWRETLLMHAVARIVLGALVPNVQASWVKLGVEGMKRCLRAGVNDFGGTLMDESISRAAGAVHGTEMTPAAIRAVIVDAGRTPRQRTTLYEDAPRERVERAASQEARAGAPDASPRAPAAAAPTRRESALEACAGLAE